MPNAAKNSEKKGIKTASEPDADPSANRFDDFSWVCRVSKEPPTKRVDNLDVLRNSPSYTVPTVGHLTQNYGLKV